MSENYEAAMARLKRLASHLTLFRGWDLPGHLVTVRLAEDGCVLHTGAASTDCPPAVLAELQSCVMTLCRETGHALSILPAHTPQRRAARRVQ